MDFEHPFLKDETAAPLSRKVQRTPTLAIVIPVFKHSVLVTEAIAAGLREARLANGVLVRINDGCPYAETHEVCLTFAAAEPDLVEYIRTPNGGLSAARNRGIKYALARFPSIETIYLLDADNRLGAGSMRRAHETMAETGAAWVYPNIDKFGLEWNGDFTAPYSVLRHLFQNICEAGSLIHRRIFDAGIFFDETMLQGYEDWEFWMQCLEAGFLGAPCASFGLQYRARRESMVRDSDRSGNAIIAKMHLKHKRLFSPRALLAMEHEQAPRYCIIDGGTQQRFSWTSVAGEVSSSGKFAELDRAFWRADLYPSQFHFPNYVVAADQRVIDELVRLKLADNVFWHIEDALETHAVVLVSLRFDDNAITFQTSGHEHLPAPGGQGPCIVAMQSQLLTECALDSSTAWIDSIRTPEPSPSVAALTVSAPFSLSVLNRQGIHSQLDVFFRALTQLRESPFKRGAAPSWEWRSTDSFIPDKDLFRRVRTHLSAMAPIARGASDDRPEIAFLLPLVSFGGVEQVGLQVAAQYKAAGWRTRLVVTEHNEAKAPARLFDVFDSILFLNDDSYADWRPSDLKYYGHELQSWPVNGRHDRLIGQLAGCAAVMVLQANHGYEVMGWLRRQGMVTINSLHLLDRDLFNVPVGHPYLTLAYEHAFDLVCAPARKLLAFCASTGVPEEKLVYLPNAPSFIASAEMQAQRRQALQQDTAPRKLRILSIGRLDRQKGGERLEALVNAARESGLEAEWRFVGGKVVPDGSQAETGLTVEPPIYDRAGVVERLLWADAVILLSRWEGSPLLILEAQSLGTIPIATDVGAVCEMIENGVNGVLVPNAELQTVVAIALSGLQRLAESTTLRAAMATQAMERMRGVNWANSAAALVEKTVALVRAKKS